MAAPQAAAGPKRKEKATGMPTPILPKSAYPPKAVNPCSGYSEAGYSKAVSSINDIILGLFHIATKSNIPVTLHSSYCPVTLKALQLVFGQ